MRFSALDHVRPLRWPDRLAVPVFASDTHYMQMAMSILTGMEHRDGDRYGPILPIAQAKDVVRWAGYAVHDDDAGGRNG